MKSESIIIPALSALILSLGACATDECLDNKNSLPLAGFYSSALSPEAVSVDSVSLLAIGAPGDSLILNNARNVSQAYLPFNLDSRQTTFRLYYDFTASANGGQPLYNDITFSYEIKPWFVSSACGAIYKYQIEEIRSTTLFLDSVTCPSGIIDNTPGQNIFFYFRTSGEGEQR